MSKGERTRQFIIEQAAPIFNQKGIAGTTIDDILAATKMAKGGLYRHFESKDEIATVMVEFLLDKLSAKIAGDMARQQTAQGKLFAFMDVYLHPLTSYIDGGCPVLNFGVEVDDTNPLLKQNMKQRIEGLQKALTDIIKQGVANQELTADIDADGFVLKTFAALEGGMLISRVTGSDKHMQNLIDMFKAELKSYAVTKK